MLGLPYSFILYGFAISTNFFIDPVGNETAFGNLLTKTGTTENDFLYTGEQYDAHTGFYYLRARYMNPSTGTFTSPDAYTGTIFDPVSLHKYLYANANPVMNRDPSGYYTLTDMEASIVISGIIGAAMNSIPSGIMRLLDGAPLDGNFCLTFMKDFIFGFVMGGTMTWMFGVAGYMATQSLLASNLFRFFLGIMGGNYLLNAIWDFRDGDYVGGVMNALTAVLFFWGASTDFFRGGGLGNHGGGNPGKNNPADDVADDVANTTDDAANAGQGSRSTGRTEANTLNEQFAMEQVMSNPMEGATVLKKVVLNDPRWPATDGWVKMQNIVVTSEGKIIIHFNYNTNTGATADFKFV